MRTAEKELILDLEEQLRDIKLPLMALKLDELYRKPDFGKLDSLRLLSELITPEYRDKMSKTLNNRLRKACLIGSPCELESCKDSTTRRYEPAGITRTLSNLNFIEDGMNLCILGASDTGKTYLAKAIGSAACMHYRVSYNRCSTLLESLVALKSQDYKAYAKKVRTLNNSHLLILDDFLLNTVTDEREIKVLMELLETRMNLSRSTIVCSQRDPESWKAMIMNDEVSANAILKRVTKHYIVMIHLIEK